MLDLFVRVGIVLVILNIAFSAFLDAHENRLVGACLLKRSCAVCLVEVFFESCSGT